MKEFKTELYKILHKRGYYGAYLLTAIISALLIVVFSTSIKDLGIEYRANNWAPLYADMLVSYMVWVLVGFAYVILSTDYVEKTVGILIVAGADRKKIYISKVILLLISAVFMVVISFVTVTVLSGLIFGWGEWNAETVSEYLKVLSKSIIFVIPFVAFYALFCSLFQNQAACLVSSFFTMTVLSVITQGLKLLLKNIKEVEAVSPCASGNIIGTYGNDNIVKWIVACFVLFIIVFGVGIFTARKREI